ncbi:hypothetical protein [Streptomyces sp. TS71-3]|uniref:hypothetical protein n=1 Tax=Streptomyces sp. TS71-3 TaxID=2733862 RepID=UPI001B0CD156|nr:hypothetical protein [Streptomyces sp. TS71-3]GHJ35227.1 lipoprotein [Streptomyces sp. TS71-3]
MRAGRTGRLHGLTRIHRHCGRVAVGTLALLALLTGCGIRATEVPTDFGPAPSRAPCSVSGQGMTAESAQGIPVQVFLVCSSQLVTVDRSVRIPSAVADDRVRVAQALLGELAKRPPTPERQAGYTTDVRGGTAVTGGRKGDPGAALRLGTPPDELTSYALAQIVCTLANSAAAADDGTVFLGGPGRAPVKRYTCTPEVRSRPGATTPPSTPAPGR